MSSFQSKIRKRLKKRINGGNRIHHISNDMFESLKLMLKSNSEEDAMLAVNIIQNSIFNDEQINHLIKSASLEIWARMEGVTVSELKLTHKKNK